MRSKMRTRIKYSRYGDQLMTDWFTVGPNLIIRGIIYLSTNQISIVEFESEVVVLEPSSNLRAAKSLVRKRLLQSGVKLGEEIRVGV